MSRQFVISRRALDETNQLTDWIAIDNESHAERFRAAVSLTFRAIMDYPALGGEFVTADKGLSGIRRRHVQGFRNYLIFYRVTAEQVVILSVLHGSRDIPSALLNDD